MNKMATTFFCDNQSVTICNQLNKGIEIHFEVSGNSGPCKKNSQKVFFVSFYKEGWWQGTQLSNFLVKELPLIQEVKFLAMVR